MVEQNGTISLAIRITPCTLSRSHAEVRVRMPEKALFSQGESTFSFTVEYRFALCAHAVEPPPLPPRAATAAIPC